MHLLILGANSEIALAVARRFAHMEKAHLYLASRRLGPLHNKAKDLEVRYQVKAKPCYFDAGDFASHRRFYQELDPPPDGVLLAFGYLGDQARAQEDFAEARRILEVNLLGAVSILEIVAADLARRRQGFIIALSSVAGERGRRSNYIYGAAKGGLTVYLSGLRQRLAPHGVRVITVLPGFVRTKMTEHLDLPEALLAEPDEVAADIYRAWRRGRDVIYSKGLWRWLMLALRTIPEKFFKKLPL